MAAPLGRDSLPDHWSYGVCKDGRVFFINDEARTTTWLHPRTGEPVNSGHMIRADLPRGWEEGFTNEGACYFLDHNQRTTAFRHPVTGQVSTENFDFILQEQPSAHMSKLQADPRPSSTISEASTAVTSSTVDTALGSKGSRSSGRVHSFGKRDHSIKRNPNVPVVVRGWLYKQDSSGMRLWKRKWFVLADYCLFYYKDSREESVLGSIPLPSYIISPVEPEDHISRKYAFKASHTGIRSYIYSKSSVIGSQAEHSGMRTYFFSADTQEDMNGWVDAMNQAALMQNYGVKRASEKLERSEKSDTLDTSERQAVPQTNHVNSYIITSPELEDLHVAAAVPEKQEIVVEVGGSRSQAFHRDLMEGFGKSPAGTTAEVEALPPESLPPSRAASRAPSRAASTLPPALRNGLLPEQNGTGTYTRGPTPHLDAEIQVQRRSALDQVEHWVKVQRGEHRRVPNTEATLPRRTPPMQPKFGAVEAYQSLPKPSRHSPPTAHRQLPSDYKYAQDRLSHFRLTHGHGTQPAPKDGTVWQLYEWQQRHRYRHGSPTAPLYTPAPDYPSAISASRGNLEVPRSISVPPSPADIPPPGPPGPRALSLRRPHTPADRRTIRPLDETPSAEVPPSSSPRRVHSHKSATIERRSMPPSGYITHTVSAPSLHGKTPEELTLLLIQLRRHQAMMAGARGHMLAHLQHYPRAQVDDTYVQLKKDLEYLDLKVTGNETLKGRSTKPVKVAESDVDVTLSRLCEQDKILQELEAKISTLKDDKDKLELVLDVSHQQMEQYQDQPAHAEKIAYQQRLLQEDVVHIRADISRVSTEMQRAWGEYSRQEQSVEQLREALQAQMNLSSVSQEKTEIKRELWRIEDVMVGLSSSKANYKITIDSVQNPERKLVPSVPESTVPSRCVTSVVVEVKPPQRSLNPSPVPPPAQQPLQHHTSVPSWVDDTQVDDTQVDDAAPPRPPLPHLYDEQPPAVPPLPRESSVIRHTSVRGLKRQSDERKRDRECSSYVNGDCKVELRSYRSEPELPGSGQTEGGYQTLPNRGLSGSSSRINQSTSISSFVTLRRGDSGTGMERPRSALERLCSSESQPAQTLHRGRMSVEEQLERMKRHQRALVRERKRNLTERQSSVSRASSRPVSSDLGSLRREQDFDLQLLERMVQREEQHGTEGRGQEDLAPPSEPQRWGQEEQAPPIWSQRPSSNEWFTVLATPMKEQDVEPVDFDLDLSRELSKPQKVPIPQRYVDLEPEEPLSHEEMEARVRNVEKIKNLLAKTSVQKLPLPVASDQPDFSGLDGALQEQERIMNMSHTLASEASIRSKKVAAKAVGV